MKTITIGRGATNTIVFNDTTVSRQHAVLRFLGENVFELEDLNSTNGTLVNGSVITTTVRVSFQDEVQFGAQKLNWEVVKKHLPQVSESKPTPTVKKAKKKIAIWPYLLLVAVILGLFSLLQQSDGEKNGTDDSQSDTLSDTIKEQSTDSTFTQTKDTNSTIHSTEQEDIANTQLSENTSEERGRLQQKKDPLEYSISCLRSKSALNELIGLGAEIEEGFIRFSSDDVGVEEERKVGKEVKKSVLKEYNLSTDVAIQQRITAIFNRLIVVLENPRMTYTFYVIESDDINAFTAGGLIFITTGIIDFAENDDELACIIGHEIYHNELGHINKLIRKEKTAKNWLGDFADWGLIASNIMGASFNQENEVYCDLYGADLAIKAGYDGKASARFWSRMEQQNNAVEKMLSTHPFSDERLECIEEHLDRNYWVGE